MRRMKTYNSFVIRYWKLDEDSQRIEIEHMQSGRRARVSSLASATEWIEAQCSKLTDDRQDEQQRPDAR